jgi:hypothetical protein
MLEGIIGLLIFIADIWAIINILQSRAKGSTKFIWILVIILLPLIGLLIWFFTGPKRTVLT